MKFRHLRTAFFSIAITSPALLFGQFDPMAVPAQSQPNRAQQTPSPATQDSAPNAGDVGQVMADKMFLRKAAEVADAIAIAIVKSPDVDLVNDRVFVPKPVLRQYHRPCSSSNYALSARNGSGLA